MELWKQFWAFIIGVIVYYPMCAFFSYEVAAIIGGVCAFLVFGSLGKLENYS